MEIMIVVIIQMRLIVTVCVILSPGCYIQLKQVLVVQMKFCVLTKHHVSLHHGFVMGRKIVHQAGMRIITAVSVCVIMLLTLHVYNHACTPPIHVFVLFL